MPLATVEEGIGDGHLQKISCRLFVHPPRTLARHCSFMTILTFALAGLPAYGPLSSSRSSANRNGLLRMRAHLSSIVCSLSVLGRSFFRESLCRPGLDIVASALTWR